jgi:hypothetical protein
MFQSKEADDMRVYQFLTDFAKEGYWFTLALSVSPSACLSTRLRFSELLAAWNGDIQVTFYMWVCLGQFFIKLSFVTLNVLLTGLLSLMMCIFTVSWIFLRMR